MRILAGEARGRVLKTREGKGTRPTDSRSREMLFNILAPSVAGARVLDLYAGSGAVGLEALSRGAAFCIFVEQNAVAARAIRANLGICGWDKKANGPDDESNPPERGQVWQTNTKTALRHLVESREQFDVLFADPPFARPAELDELCERLDESGTLQAPGGVLVIQHHRKARPVLSRFQLEMERRAGESVLSFFRAPAF